MAEPFAMPLEPMAPVAARRAAYGDTSTGTAGAQFKEYPAPDWAEGVAIRDWEILFNAVTSRLRLVATDDTTGVYCTQLAGKADTVKACVLECVAALEQLKLTLSHELARCESIELQAFDARTALAQARSDGL